MSVIYFIYAGFYTLAILLTITQVGKSREPISGGSAAFVVLINAFLVFLLVYAGMSVGASNDY